jgi:hypothetical protein
MENNEMRPEINLAPLEQASRDITPRKVKKIGTPAEDATEALRLRMREKVKGIFHFYECPQGSMEFTYKEFKNDPVEKYAMIDGQIYTIPLGVARHLNKSGKYPLYGYTKDADGRVTMRKDKMVSRFGFESLEFKDYAELDNNLV